MAGELDVTIDHQGLSAGELKRFEPALAASMRKRLETIGDKAAEAVKNVLRQPSPDDGPNTGTGRAAIAAATTSEVSFSPRTTGLWIVSSGSNLPAENKGLLKSYNLRSFRHPVFGNPEVWVAQKGRPYFGAVIKNTMDAKLYKQVDAALAEAMLAIGARNV